MGRHQQQRPLAANRPGTLDPSGRHYSYAKQLEAKRRQRYNGHNIITGAANKRPTLLLLLLLLLLIRSLGRFAPPAKRERSPNSHGRRMRPPPSYEMARRPETYGIRAGRNLFRGISGLYHAAGVT